MNHWEEGLYVKNIDELKEHYKGGKVKVVRTNSVFNFFNKKGIKSAERVLEPGCNVGRNLSKARQVFGCDVYGCDINQDTMDVCSEIFGDRGHFFKKDLRNYYFDDYPDNYFDIGITMGFLMHIPKGEEKTKLINGLLRVCKYAVIYEPSDEANKSDIDKANEFHVSYEDYRSYSEKIERTDTEKYGLRLFFYDGSGGA